MFHATKSLLRGKKVQISVSSDDDDMVCASNYGIDPKLQAVRIGET